MSNYCYREEKKMLEKKSIFLSQIFFSRIVGVFGHGEACCA